MINGSKYEQAFMVLQFNLMKEFLAVYALVHIQLICGASVAEMNNGFYHQGLITPSH